MRKKLYYVAAIAVLVCLAGLVGAQITGTKPAPGGVVAPKEKTEQVTIEQRLISLEKNQEKILAELKAIKENQVEILDQTRKIFNRMRRK